MSSDGFEAINDKLSTFLFHFPVQTMWNNDFRLVSNIFMASLPCQPQFRRKHTFSIALIFLIKIQFDRQ